MTTKKPRRIRMFKCPHCGAPSPMTRACIEAGDHFALSTCHACYCVAENDKVESWLEEPLAS